jgi:hypothetical protein
MSTGPDPADPLARRRARRLVDEGTILDPVMDPEERARIGLSGDPDDPVPVLIENTQLSHWQQQALDTDMLGQLRGMAGFLSIRPEFIGQAEEVKRSFLASALSLERERYFEGHGLIDLMRASSPARSLMSYSGEDGKA